jgi:dihydrofolate synthase/folylpolyglutamate synthase
MNFEEAVKFLKSFVSYEDIVLKKYDEDAFNLDRFEKFLSDYGVEYKNLKCIHIAGSKGKGTAAHLIASYLAKTGRKVGLFTSPYILNIREMIVVNGEMILEKKFVEYVVKLKKFLEDSGRMKSGNVITYFEMITTIMFQYFLDEKVDLAVIEVGLGGRLDSTNVCNPFLTVLTLVEKEHTEILGRTYREILNEKLGIVKNGIPLVVGSQNRIVLSEIGRRRLNVPVFYTDDVAKTALMIFLKEKFDEKLYEKVRGGLKIIGRFQVENVKGKTVVFDMAHTPASARLLRRNLIKNFPGRKFVFLISMMKFKNVKGFLSGLGLRARKAQGHFLRREGSCLFTKSHPTRSLKCSEMKKFYPKGIVIENPKKAFQTLLKKLKKNEILVVTGSHFLIGEILG